jgi:clan AA aspartic protease (TIGR02281 family)
MIQAWSQMIQAGILEDRLSVLARKKRAIIQQREAALSGLVDALSNRYGELANDSEVMPALEEINKTANPRVKLGPMEDDKADLARIAASFHRSMDDLPTSKEKGLLLETVGDLNQLAALTESFQRELGGALARQQSRQHDAEIRKKRLADSLAAEARLQSEPTRASAGQKALAVAQLKGVLDQIKRLRDEADREEKARKDQAEQITTLREALVKCVDALRKRGDPSRRVHEEPAGNKENRGTTANLKEKPNIPIAPSLSKQQRAILDNAERAIHAETIPLEPDKTVFWVRANLNGKPDLRMVVDPDAETIRVSARFAAAVGITSDRKEPEVQISTSDGTTLAAHPAQVASVEVGPFTINNVECLIMPDGYEAPPVLGASFLDQFASRLDPEAAQLTLVKVDVKPVHSRAAPRTGASGKAR